MVEKLIVDGRSPALGRRLSHGSEVAAPSQSVLKATQWCN